VIELQNPYEFEGVPTPEAIKNWCDLAIKEATVESESDNYEILIRVVDETESAELNLKYRDKVGSTNVLSFTNEIPDFMLDIPELNEQNKHLGDLVICQPVVVKEAADQNKTEKSHWAHLIVHGLLHLQGYDHIEDSDAKKMESLEIRILEQLGVENPYE